MSYAQAAASGPSQSAEEARAPPLAGVERTDESTHSLIDVDSPHVSSVPSDFESQSVKTETQAERLEREAENAQKVAAAKMTEDKEKSKREGKKAASKLRDNADNPVLIGNAVAITALGGFLSFGAYKKYSAGQLSWKVAGAWAGAVGLFAAGDYFLSQYLFKKYPPK